MKRFFILSFIGLLLLAVAGYIAYRALLPGLIADALVSESPGYIPKRLKTRVEAIRKPINKGTEAMIVKMQESDISMNEVLHTIDQVTEEQFHAFLDDFNETKPKTTDEVFDLAIRHFSTTIDLEVFREPFNKHFDIKQIRNAVGFANINRRSNDVDMATAKAILKKIIIEKEKELSN